jgi:hypothetical protein
MRRIKDGWTELKITELEQKIIEQRITGQKTVLSFLTNL